MSAADEIKAQLAKALDVGRKRQAFAEHMQRQEFAKAAEVAGELGGLLPRHVVVDLRSRRPRP